MGGVLLALIIFLVVGVAVICSRRKKQKNKPTKQEGKKNFVLLIITYNNFSVCCFLNKQFLFFAKSLLIHQKSQKWAKLKVFFFVCILVRISETISQFSVCWRNDGKLLFRPQTIILMTHLCYFILLASLPRKKMTRK